MNNAILKSIQNLWHHLVSETKSDIIEYATPAIDFVEQNGGKAVLTLAEAVLMGADVGTPWATLSATLIASAKDAGLQLVEGAAGAILNLVKANLVAQGKATA